LRLQEKNGLIDVWSETVFIYYPKQAETMDERRLRKFFRYGDTEHILRVEGLEFDLEGDPSGVVMDGDGYTIYYLEATQEILSVEAGVFKPR
jgi:hypothetical protein